MIDVNQLKEKDWIAFPFTFNGRDKEIMVSNIIFIHEDGFIVHFLYGHSTLSEFVKKEEVIAIGDRENGSTKIRGWSGKFNIINNELYNQYKLNE